MIIAQALTKAAGDMVQSEISLTPDGIQKPQCPRDRCNIGSRPEALDLALGEHYHRPTAVEPEQGRDQMGRRLD
jgi:hypothetical protein